MSAIIVYGTFKSSYPLDILLSMHHFDFGGEKVFD